MADPPAIPGFYYDPEKKKYFKIQKNHLAPPGSKYSQDAINMQEKLSKKRKREDAEKAQLKAQTLKRSLILTNAKSWTLTREVKGLRTDPDTHAKALVSFLRPSAFIEVHDHWYHRVHPSNNIQSFDYDALGLTLVAGIAGRDKCMTSTFVDPYQALFDGEAIHRQIMDPRSTPKWHQRKYTPTNSDITSVNIGPNRTLMFTTLGYGSTAEIHLSTLNEHLPSSTENRDYLDCSVVLGPNVPDTYWSGTVNRFVTDKDIFSVGSSIRVVNVENHPHGPHYKILSAYPGRQHSDRPDDVLSVEWLSENVLAAGHRSGNIVLFDSRAQDSVLRLAHPSSAIQIRRADFDTGLVVAGLRHNMNLYDLRMAGAYKRKEVSRHVFRFDYTNECATSYGLDVHRESGLVAAAQGPRVQLYSIKSGAKIRHFDTSPTVWHGLEHQPRHVMCLRFVEEVKGPEKGRTKLLGSIGTRVVQFR